MNQHDHPALRRLHTVPAKPHASVGPRCRARRLVRRDGQGRQRSCRRLQHYVACVLCHVQRGRRAARARQVPQVLPARRPERRPRLGHTPDSTGPHTASPNNHSLILIAIVISNPANAQCQAQLTRLQGTAQPADPQGGAPVSRTMRAAAARRPATAPPQWPQPRPAAQGAAPRRAQSCPPH